MEKIIEQAICEIAHTPDAAVFAEINSTAYQIAARVFDLTSRNGFVIPDGYDARIEGNKIIVKPKETEDERIAREIWQFIEADVLGKKPLTPRTDTLEEWFHWLFKPRNNWKPTKKQMEWLGQAVRLSANKLRTHDIILSLYNDLKKLM